MEVRFLLGPAGSGKTSRCLAEISEALRQSPTGLPLLLLAPKQATYQLERRLLAEGTPAGYTRLKILSFDRLARFIVESTGPERLALLSEEGRVMVLRALLADLQGQLAQFHATARLPGFVQQLNRLLRELQHAGVAEPQLRAMENRGDVSPRLRAKLHDLALIVGAYVRWLQHHQLEDAGRLLTLATEALTPPGVARSSPVPFQLQGVWLDGFAELTECELALLTAVAPRTRAMTLAFCLDGETAGTEPDRSFWAAVAGTYRKCRNRLGSLPEVRLATEVLPRSEVASRYAEAPVLRTLERHWSRPAATEPVASAQLTAQLRIVRARHREVEVAEAAREILRFVRNGGRFRDCSVVLRRFEGYHELLRRNFERHGIPYFLDRREPIAHHPLAELTRGALRTLTFGWRPEDWFAALKSGLVTDDDALLDELENLALAAGWQGSTWLKSGETAPHGEHPARLEVFRRRLVAPFERLWWRWQASGNADAQAGSPLTASLSGHAIAEGLRELWRELEVEPTLDRWTHASGPAQPLSPRVHLTVWDQLNDWLDNLRLAFADRSLPLREWLPIIEAGMGSLTVGQIPPGLDQVLVGTIDRSRNPEVSLAIVLGLNESVFPSAPAPDLLLTEAERVWLEEHRMALGGSRWQALSQERYLGYIACTRARKRLVLSFCQQDSMQRPLLPSAFIGQILRLFPGLTIDNAVDVPALEHVEHWTDFAGAWMKTSGPLPSANDATAPTVPEAARPWVEKLEGLRRLPAEPQLSPQTIHRLYGNALRTSVTALESFAGCPFRFFLGTGLRAQERKLFDYGVREAGEFRHVLLKRFHDSLGERGLTWHSITVEQARSDLDRIAHDLAIDFHHGVMVASAASRFTLNQTVAAMGDFVETTVRWMRQYEFEPVAAELGFGGEANLQAYEMPLAGQQTVALQGSMDRVDLWRGADSAEAYFVVLDYKSRARRIDLKQVRHGLQLQLLAYVNRLRHLRPGEVLDGAESLTPAGFFYAPLQADYSTGANRLEVINGSEEGRSAFQHRGCFRRDLLDLFDKRPKPDGREFRGDQFAYRLRARDGDFYEGSGDAFNELALTALLDEADTQIRSLAEAILAGRIEVSPYRYGSEVACDRCAFRPVCRFDPFTQPYRSLADSPNDTSTEGDSE